MSIWYRGHYGSWKDKHGIQRLTSTYNKKDIMNEAQMIANEKNVTVVVIGEYPTGHGLSVHHYHIEPNIKGK